MESLRLITMTLLATIACTVGGSSTPEEFEALYIDLETCDYNSDMCNTPAFYNTQDVGLLELHQKKCLFEDYSDGTPGRYVACHPKRRTAEWYRDRCISKDYIHYNKSCSEELHKREFCRYSEVCLRRFSPSAPSCITQTTISDGDVLCGHNSSWEDNSSSSSSLDSVLGHNPTSMIIILTVLCVVLGCSLLLNGVLIYLQCIRNSRSTRNNDPERIQGDSENEATKGLLGNTKEIPGIRRQRSHSSHPDDATDDEKEKTASSSEQLTDTGL